MSSQLDHRLTTPLYDPTFAARMLAMNPNRVRRWMFGYTFKPHSKKGLVITRHKGPVIRRPGDGPHLVSFLDLMELYFAKAFFDRGISVQRMRCALEEAHELIRVDYPFARRMFFTAGREIFLQLREEDPKRAPHLMHLLKSGQWAIADVVLQHAKQLDFAPESGAAVAWWPLGRLVPVTVDPQYGYGEPTIAGKGLKTAVVYDMFMAEKKRVDVVARWMRIEPREVEAAVRWEAQLEAAA